MHRMIWLKVGGRNYHLLKLAGSFFVFAFVLKALEAAYQTLVVASKAMYAYYNPTVVASLFDWGLKSPSRFGIDDVVGVLLGPVSSFMFWLGLAVLALIIYRSGQFVLPIEEFEKAEAHNAKMIAHARVAHAKWQKKK